jgi:hypothetical protein
MKRERISNVQCRISNIEVKRGRNIECRILNVEYRSEEDYGLWEILSFIVHCILLASLFPVDAPKVWQSCYHDCPPSPSAMADLRSGKRVSCYEGVARYLFHSSSEELMKLQMSLCTCRLFSFVTVIGLPTLKCRCFEGSIRPRSLTIFPGVRKSVFSAMGMQGTLLRCASFTPSVLNSAGLNSGERVDWGKINRERFFSRSDFLPSLRTS